MRRKLGRLTTISPASLGTGAVKVLGGEIQQRQTIEGAKRVPREMRLVCWDRRMSFLVKCEIRRATDLDLRRNMLISQRFCILLAGRRLSSHFGNRRPAPALAFGPVQGNSTSAH